MAIWRCGAESGAGVNEFHVMVLWTRKSYVCLQVCEKIAFGEVNQVPEPEYVSGDPPGFWSCLMSLVVLFVFFCCSKAVERNVKIAGQMISTCWNFPSRRGHSVLESGVRKTLEPPALP